MLAFEQFRNATGVVHDLDAAAEFTHRIVQDLAVLVGQQRDDLVRMLLEQLLEPEHDLGALYGRRVAPGRECGLGCADGILHRVSRRHRDVPGDLASRRIGDRQWPVVVGNVLAVNEVADDIGGVDALSGSCVHSASGPVA